MSYTWPCQQHDDCLINTKLADWKILDGCFREEPRVKAGDIDGIVSQNNAVLILEKKPIGAITREDFGIVWPQKKAFRTLAGQGNTVIAGWWDARDGSDLARMMIWNLTDYPNEKLIIAGIEQFREACRKWWLSKYNGRNC